MRLLQRVLGVLVLLGACVSPVEESEAGSENGSLSSRSGGTIEPLEDTTDGLLIRGVPAFGMFKGDYDGRGRRVDVGCGPMALTQLLLWWDARGYYGLLDGYTGSGGRVDAEELALDLHDNYLLTLWGLDGETAVPAGQIRDGVVDFVEDQGYEARVRRVTVEDGDEESIVPDLWAALGAGEPVVMLYDASPNDDEGAGGRGRGLGGYTHYGLIVGYKPGKILVDEGIRNLRNVTYDWHDGVIGDGDVELWFTRITGRRSSDQEWCAHHEDDIRDYVTAGDGYDVRRNDYTFSSEVYDEHYVMEPLAGENCGVLATSATITMSATGPSAGSHHVPGERVRVDVIGSGHSADVWEIDRLTTWLVTDAGSFSLQTRNVSMNAEDPSTWFNVELPLEARGEAAILIIASNDGESSVNYTTESFFIDDPVLVTEAEYTRETAGRAADAYLLELGRGQFDIEIEAHAPPFSVRVFDMANHGELLRGSVLTRAGAVSTTSIQNDSVDRDVLVVVEPVSGHRARYTIRVNGEEGISLGWITPTGYASHSFTDSLRMLESVDFLYDAPAWTLSSVAVQALNDPASERVLAGYDVELLVDGRWTSVVVDRGHTTDRTDVATLVHWNESDTQLIKVRVTRMGLANEGFRLEIHPFSTAPADPYSIRAQSVDIANYYREEYEADYALASTGRVAAYQLIDVPAGRELSVAITCAAYLSRPYCTYFGTVSIRALDVDTMEELSSGDERSLTIEPDRADRSVLIELTAPGIPLSGSQTVDLTAFYRLL